MHFSLVTSRTFSKLAEKYTHCLVVNYVALSPLSQPEVVSKVRIVTFTSITLRARAHVWQLHRCVFPGPGGVPLWVQVCARVERTGTASKYANWGKMQNGKLLRGTERETELLKDQGKQGDWQLLSVIMMWRYTEANRYKVPAMCFKKTKLVLAWCYEFVQVLPYFLFVHDQTYSFVFDIWLV